MRDLETNVKWANQLPINGRPVTMQDLELFRQQLLLDIKLLLAQNNGHARKSWLKSYQVRQMLGCSNGKLQALRTKGILPYSKIGNVIYYDQDDIDDTLDKIRKTIGLKHKPYSK